MQQPSTKLVWTKKRPLESGFYFLRSLAPRSKHGVRVVKVVRSKFLSGKDVTLVWGYEIDGKPLYKFVNGMWEYAGPIGEPDEAKE